MVGGYYVWQGGRNDIMYGKGEDNDIMYIIMYGARADLVKISRKEQLQIFVHVGIVMSEHKV